jgi:malonyl-CoA/methylmalonyl-CoA synthetase
MTLRPAIVAADGTFTYDELDAATNRVATALLDGAPDLGEARVAFFITPSFAHVAVRQGIWRAGGVAVPLAISHPPAELEYVIRDSAATFLVAEPSAVDMLTPIAKAVGARLLTPAELLGRPEGRPLHGSSMDVRADFQVGPARDDRSLPQVAATWRAMIVYTSGTTGRPKGAVTTHANVGAQISSLVEAWGWSPTDRLLLTLPLHHVHGIVNGLGCALAVRATCEILPAFDAEVVWDRLASGEITVFTAVPTIYRRLIASWEAAPPDVQRRRSEGVRVLRLMMSGSAALPVQTLERWREISGHTLLERYGMTEIGMALANPLHGERRPGYVGIPLPDVDVQIVDEEGIAVLEGNAGELEVSGPTVFKEYWQRPDETRQAFRRGWFRTGDVAVVENGYYRLLGRTSVDIIKTGGFKVSALEIEEVLRTHPAIAECAVVGVEDAEWGERVSAALELQPSATLSLEELQQWAKERLAPYKIPRAVCTVKTLPRNAMGKVVKPDVTALFQRS